MKRLLFLLIGVVIIANACQTNTELTDADKEAIVQSVKKVSQEYWALFGETYNDESFGKVKKYLDQNSDIIWLTDPVASIANTRITNKKADGLGQIESIFESRISSPNTIMKRYYSVLSDEKVLEVLQGEFSYIKKDSTNVGPFKWVGTSMWANIDGEWKLQFLHNSIE